MHLGARQLLLVARHVLFAFVVERSPLYVGTLIAKVQQCPQFKTRVGDRKLDPIGSGLLPGFRYQPMLVYVEDTPDLIVPEVRIFLAPCQPLGVLFLLKGPLHQSLGLTARTDFQVYEAPFQVAGLLKVPRLRLCALANDQKSLKGQAEGTAAA
jgi:hypothetical protein